MVRIWPFHRLTTEERESTREKDFSNIAFSSIFVFHDPRNWALDIQIMSDVIRSYPHGLGASYPARNLAVNLDSKITKNGVELFFCNPDLLWKAQYQVPRFGQGAFKEAFQAVFKVFIANQSHAGRYGLVYGFISSQAATSSTYPYTQFGKPHKLTYDYGAKMLSAQYTHLYGTQNDRKPTM